MKYSSIDIGTNTILLLIAEIKDDHSVNTLFEKQEIPRLGKGVDENRNISPDSINKAILILQEFKKICEFYGVEHIFVSATSFLRDANNRNEFIDKIYIETGLKINLLTGDEEAKWSLWGGIYDKLEQIVNNEITLIDIGGGSTEVNNIKIDKNLSFTDRINKSKISSVSIDIGSVRVTEKFFRNNDYSESNIKDAVDFINSEFNNNINFELKTSYLVGVAGTITTITAFHKKLLKFEIKEIDSQILTVIDINRLFEQFISESPDKLLSVGSYMTGREDIISAGTLILKLFMEKYGFEEIMVSTKGLRYGTLLKQITK